MPLVLALLLVTTVLTGCWHHAQVRPAEVVFACGDGNFYVTGLLWTHWGAADAEGRGVGHQNDCTPDCASGHFHTYKLSVRLSRPVVCVKARREFSRLAWRFTATKPAHVTRAGSETLPRRFLKLKP
jgi:hypothetical protein